jgi:hypothetical protein
MDMDKISMEEYLYVQEILQDIEQGELAQQELNKLSTHGFKNATTYKRRKRLAGHSD